MAGKATHPSQLTFTDLDLSRWKEYEEVETDSLWIIPSRASGNGHQLDYHGNYVPQIATQLLTRFTRTDDVVLDLFLGSGTTAIEAANLGRRCIGVDLKPDLIAAVSEKIASTLPSDRTALFSGDSASEECRTQAEEILTRWGRDRAQFLLLHPPYHDIIRFSDSPEDLSNAPDTDAFLAMFRRVAENGHALLEPGRYAAVIIGDKYAKGELIPLGFQCMQVMQDLGFRLKSIIVKNISGNEKGKGRDSNLWRYRALKGGFYLFKHEYIILCQKPLR
ncbi:MAG: site-specific DNA-methyltransferase [Armatimonadetes bacterium]|nr:site-specific DNA-methyltransferase [Armatimonadota bacterium]